MRFDELPLDNAVLDALDAMNFSECTPIQEKAIKPLLEGRDLIGIAQTGTGKTAAYILPVISKLNSGNYEQDAINCLIMTPTRELAQQVDKQVEGFSYFMPVSSVAVYGGNDGIRYEQEKNGLRKGADIVIATPGRLLSHLATGNIDFSHVSFFILDEADRMLDMGFYDDIMKIVAQLPENRQTMLFSATMPDNINKLAKSILKDPVEVRLAVSKPADKIRQQVYLCHENMKMTLLGKLLNNMSPDHILLFASSKLKVKQIAQLMAKKGYNVGQMHSDLTQAERDNVMYEFKTRAIDILVATDILSRGIDIDDIQMVINYDVPKDPEDYIHRIGRTARANRDGEAITFCCGHDVRYMQRIEKLIGKELQKPDLPEGCGDKPEYAPYKMPSYKGKQRNKRRFGNKKKNDKGSSKEGNDKQSVANQQTHKEGKKRNNTHKRRNKTNNSPKQPPTEKEQ